MRGIQLISACVLSVSIAAVTPSFASPLMGAPTLAQEDSDPLIQNARIFCYNTYSGRFLHWGRCGGYRAYYSHPRVYCRLRYSGRFLHWGRC